jgi:hypothetical protein
MITSSAASVSVQVTSSCTFFRRLHVRLCDGRALGGHLKIRATLTVGTSQASAASQTGVIARASDVHADVRPNAWSSAVGKTIAYWALALQGKSLHAPSSQERPASHGELHLA